MKPRSPLPPMLVALYNASFGSTDYLRFRARGCRRPIQTYKPNGKRECARRRRQIEQGRLRAS